MRTKTVPALSALPNHWFAVAGCNRISTMAAATKTTMGIAAGIQPRRKASDFSLSNGSVVGDEVVPYPNTSLPPRYTMPMNTTSHV
jgi:hypothetical protein